MRVLHVIASLDPVYGGPSVAVREMCHALQVAGVSVEIAATNAAGARNAPLPDAENANGESFPVHVFSRVRPYTYMTSPLLSRWLEWHVAEFDVVHVHALFSHPTAMACAWARRNRVPYVIRPLGLLDPWCLRRNPWRKRVHWALVDRRNLAGAAAFHFTSEMESESARWIPGNARRWVIPLGAPPESGAPPRPKRRGAPAGAAQAGRPSAFTILFLSRVDPKKGLDLLVPALARLRDRGYPFRLVVAGPDENGYRARVENLVKRHHLQDRVSFPGFVQGAQKESLLASADLFVLPSYQENFAIAAVEALQQGIPVLVSDQVAIHDDIRRAGAGRVVKCDPQALAEGLMEMLDRPAELKRMGERGRQLVRREFSWPVLAGKLVKAYGELANPAPIPTATSNLDSAEDEATSRLRLPPRIRGRNG